MIRLGIAGTSGGYELRPSKIIAVGLNYREHVAESPAILDRQPAKAAVPTEPILFAKTPNVLVASGEDIVIPTSFLAASGIARPRTDYEAELAVVIGRRCRNASPGEARSFVLGYTCFNDVSQREIQNLDRSGWFRGKSFDSFGPAGPKLLLDRDVADPQRLRIECRLNGRTVQSASTADMIFGVAELVSYISRNMTLEEGDLIATGTPSGVGALRAGDLVEVEIEGIGVLRNRVVEE
ncbi:MAG TPA: fumarylacetoacetate hydrolase family protein [Rectinemataceae bacterium]|nr:fumarylacetoacetate hydrolase family protein [Rectinemataceae bacterium]